MFGDDLSSSMPEPVDCSEFSLPDTDPVLVPADLFVQVGDGLSSLRTRDVRPCEGDHLLADLKIKN